MPTKTVYNLKGLNTKIQPFDQVDGQVIHCVNMYTDLVGAKAKRPGYVTFNGTADGSAVNSLFQYQKGDGTTNYLYRASGSSLYYYNEGAGTGDWTLATNGTISPGAHVGKTIFDDVLILGDGVGSTRHTTDGVTFTDTSLAPIGQYFTNEFGRVFVGGTASDLFYSSANDGTNWQTSGTSDSSSLKIPGAGKINGVFASNDRVVSTKTSGAMKKWDDYALTSVPTTKGYASPYSVVDIDGYNIGLNPLGLFGYGGGRPEILSNPVEKHIYNNDNSGIAGSVFTTAPAGVNKYQYMISVGTITDSYTQIAIPDCVMCYNYQLDEWTDYQYANRPTAFTTYIDSSGNEQTIFGDSSGQVYKLAGTATSDNGTPINCSLIGFVHLGSPESEKIFNKIDAFANPGCEASLFLAASDVFDLSKVNWVGYGSLKSGKLEVRKALRGNFLFYKVIESSTTVPFQFYGFAIEYDFQGD
jgi:hypothetical protein